VVQHPCHHVASWPRGSCKLTDRRWEGRRWGLGRRRPGWRRWGGGGRWGGGQRRHLLVDHRGGGRRLQQGRCHAQRLLRCPQSRPDVARRMPLQPTLQCSQSSQSSQSSLVPFCAGRQGAGHPPLLPGAHCCWGRRRAAAADLGASGWGWRHAWWVLGWAGADSGRRG
jgi:hypothetical protein